MNSSSHPFLNPLWRKTLTRSGAFLLLALGQLPQAWAFPEMVRHGYVNCTSCHISPNGGGLLNEYGRQSSQAVLSTWGSENEAKPFYNLYNQPSWLDTGAFIRGVQTFQDNAAVKQGNFWGMQFDVEAAVRFGEGDRFTADASIGISPDVLNGIQVPGTSPGVSHRHYLMYHLTDNSTLRAGKYLLDYGIYFPDHTIPTRQGLGFDEGHETYNLEYSYQGDAFTGSITATVGRFDDPSLLTEKGGAATGALLLSDRYKLGWSAYYGTQNGSSRELTGPYALLGFNERAYLSAEADLKFGQSPNQASTEGLATYERLGYEIFQGLQIYWLQETSISDFGGKFYPSNINPQYGVFVNRFYGTGPGVYWFPRPHFYVNVELQDQWSPGFPSAQLYGFLTGNFYL